MPVIATILPDEKNDVILRANALYNANKLPEAAAVAEEYLFKNPDDAQALVILAQVLKKAGHLVQAYQLARRTTELRPDKIETWSTFGQCAQSLWRLDEANAHYRKALQRSVKKEQTALYNNNIGSVYLDKGEFDKAEPYMKKALELVPNDSLARHNMGLILLAQRKWKEGWPYYSASVGTHNRLKIKYLPDPGEPEWDGSPSKTVVVYGEQGLGDEVCSASMLPNVIASCGKVIIDCDKRLASLFRRSFPKATVYGTRWEKGLRWDKKDRDIDASISGFEVGKFFRNSEAEFPGTPYLVADPDRVTMWKALWAMKKKPAIGIAWTGGTPANAGLFRQLPLDEWKPIFDAVDAHWVSLQYKDASKEIEGTPVTQYDYATVTKDYDQTAALVASLDMVITMQTSVAHLAGALGIPVWTLIPSTSQWRYGEGFKDLRAHYR
jgi:tetratricopeptide (TPR) repeat protein